MLQTVITYEKSTSIIISIIHVNSAITNATALKVPGYEVMITMESDVFNMDEFGVMRLNKKAFTN